LREAQQVAQVGSWDLNLDTGGLWWSDELVRIYGGNPGSVSPTASEIIERIHPDDRLRVEGEYWALIGGESETAGTQVRFRMEDGSICNLHVLWNLEQDQSGKALRFFGTISDVTAQHRAEEGLRRAAAVFDNATEGIVISDATGLIIDVNAAFSGITGYSHEQAIGQSLDLVNSGRHDPAFLKDVAREVFNLGTWEGELWIRHKGGAAIPAWVSIGRTLGEGDAVEQVVFIFNDMTERKKIEELIAHQANYDMLTGIPNRSLFIDRLSQETLGAEREGKGVALLFIDLDNFKTINDTLGHTAGDEVLMKSAMRIAESIREEDTVARVGGDEFAVVVPHLEDTIYAEEVASRILSALSAPLSVQGNDVITTASIGIAIFPSDSPHKDALLRDADFAMYRSKESGGNAIQFYTAEMNERALRRIRVEAELKCALDHGEFEVYYQPIVSLPEKRIVCVEALLRWNSPTLGMVMPTDFLPIAESTGVIESIGAWVLKQACSQVKAWQGQGMVGLRVAVNLSAREVDRGDPCKSIAAALQESGLSADCLEIEVTEQVLLKDVARASATFQEMNSLGVRLAIDDFGTGYSALSYLRNFPFDTLKIDRAFVQDALLSDEGMSLLKAIIAMAKSLHLKIIGEGVELSEQCELLCELGCEFAQGYFFAEPRLPEDVVLVGELVADSDVY
jgi:diguanylate cyclase (GGDEF)-like protein/PAS domain S-box-containing protein